ncbi:MAG: hypothetical protein LBP32_06665 [Spirochaetaceae bacterium]|jgi:hypothetical protein|nr:hypothetical protein [Spirochaetaceae bacterium]
MKRLLGFLIIINICRSYPVSGQMEQNNPAGETIPEPLMRPERGEAPRYPRDMVIGELGRGDGSVEAYVFARRIMTALLGRIRDSRLLAGLDKAFLEEVFTALDGIKPQTYHLGGGREEPDGNTSFLFRFIGREMGIAGELYITGEEDAWRLDDLIIEEARDLSSEEGGYPFDFSPYERFF